MDHLRQLTDFKERPSYMVKRLNTIKKVMVESHEDMERGPRAISMCENYSVVASAIKTFRLVDLDVFKRSKSPEFVACIAEIDKKKEVLSLLNLKVVKYALQLRLEKAISERQQTQLIQAFLDKREVIKSFPSILRWRTENDSIEQPEQLQEDCLKCGIGAAFTRGQYLEDIDAKAQPLKEIVKRCKRMLGGPLVFRRLSKIC